MSLLPDLRADWSVAGQGRAVAVLQRAVDADAVGHAWAFVGPPGVGQEQAARMLAAGLNCRSAAPPCGVCDVCDRCRRGAYPSYWEFAPTGAQHRVDDVRGEWLRTASLSAVEGRWKVLRVIDADRMNEAAANAFLKGLEEPPERTLWVLDVADPDELPDTILSRCRVLRFLPWGRDDLDAEAARLGLDGADRRLAVRAAMGLPVTLGRLAGHGGLDDLRAHREIPRRLREEGPGFALLAARGIDDEVKRRTAALKQEHREELAALTDPDEGYYGGAPPRALTKQVEDRAARRERNEKTAVVQAALDDLAGWLRDCLLVAGGGDAADAVHADDAEGLRADAGALGPANLLLAADLVFATRESLELNVQVGLALEALFLDLSTMTIGSGQ